MKEKKFFPIETIEFAVGSSSFSPFIVAKSQKGLCALLLGDESQLKAMLQQAMLKQRFQAYLVERVESLAPFIMEVRQLLEKPGHPFDLPLDEKGTPFQLRVWQALREIPLGSTASYREIAHKIGQPLAARAVARACGANSLAIVTPCHRVIGSAGQLSGYRFGIALKKKRLELEKAF